MISIEEKQLGMMQMLEQGKATSHIQRDMNRKCDYFRGMYKNANGATGLNLRVR